MIPRTSQRGSLCAAALAVAWFVAAPTTVPLSGPAFAQPVPQAGGNGPTPGAEKAPSQAETPAAEEAWFSKECKTPAITLRGDTPMPNLAKALKGQRVGRILTVGGPARAGADAQNEGYYATIERLLRVTLKGVDIQIQDIGVSGELMRDAAERIKQEVALNAPNLVLWQVGTNDALSHIPADQFETDLTDAVRWLKAHDVDVVLVGVHYLRSLKSDPAYQSIRHAVHRVAAKEKVLKIGRYEVTEWQEKSRAPQGETPADEFAMTEAGYACMAEYVARGIAAASFSDRAARRP